jgi:hypothetical protein
MLAYHLRPMARDFTRATNVTLLRPRVNWTEALGEVLRDSRKGPKTIVPRKGRAPDLT